MAHSSEAIPAVSAAGLLHRADAVLGRIVAVIAASILLVEVFLLLANVIARYVFNRPLVWGDELASILFLWLCVFGAVLRRSSGSRSQERRFATIQKPSHMWLVSEQYFCTS